MTRPLSEYRIGAVSAFTCLATYLIGFYLLISQLVDFGYGTSSVDALAFLSFASENTGLMIGWNTAIYVVNGLAVIALSISLSRLIEISMPLLGSLVRHIGLAWGALVIGAGMISNVALEQALPLLDYDPEGAVSLWRTMHSVELGIGGGNEIVGGTWLLLVCLGILKTKVMPHWLGYLGLGAGLAGVLTVIVPIGDLCGAIFGLGLIAWFGCVGFILTLRALHTDVVFVPSTA